MAPLAHLVAGALLALLALPGWSAATQYVYVWAGAANATTARDTLFVFDTATGRLVRAVPTPYAGLEPHHCALSADGKTLGAGGLLAALGGLPSILFFSLSNPQRPVLLPVPDQPKQSAIADAFQPMPGGGFLVTMMGSSTGGSPGRVAKYNSSLRLVAEYPTDLTAVTDPNPGFNPHGFNVDWARGTMVTSDYIVPASTLAGSSGVVARTTARTWTLNSRGDWVVKATLDAAGVVANPAAGEGGMMDTELIGNTGLYYVSGGAGYLYLVNPADSTIKLAYDIGNQWRPVNHCLMKSFRSGTRLVFTVFATSSVQLLDTTNPAAPVLLDAVALTATGLNHAFPDPSNPTGVGAHYVSVSSDESTVAISTYFLDEGAAGIVHAAGDRTVRLFTLDSQATKLSANPTVPIIDMKAVLPGSGGFRPHCVVFAPITDQGDQNQQ